MANESFRPSRSSEVPPALASVAGMLREERRLGSDVEIIFVGPVLEVRRTQLVVAVVSQLALESGAIEGYLDRLVDGKVALLFSEGAPADGFDRLPSRAVVSVIDPGASSEAVFHAVEGLFDRLELRRQTASKAVALHRYRYELGELIEIARALTQERDISRLLGLILEKSRFITGADAGSIYVVESHSTDAATRTLRFKTSQNFSCDYESSEFTVPVSTRSISGAAVVSRRAINIADAYRIPEGAPYGFDRSFDEKVGYRTRSVIAVPMISAEDEVIGVIQLINKKTDPNRRLTSPEDFDREVVPFDQSSEEILATLAAQAGIALENALLYDEIKRIFEGFVRASVHAIEQRDPTTSGHSFRVSLLSVRLAEAVDRVETGPYAGASFTRRELKELEYASLLHDFGKIGVREKVLVKAKKLYPGQLASIRARFDFLVKATEAETLAKKLAAMGQGAGGADLQRFDEELAARRAEIDQVWGFIVASNEPTVLSSGDFTRIADVGARTYVDLEGQERRLLTPQEVESLQVTRGSLNAGEIDEIRSHVTHTVNFLSQIPWGKSFAHVTRIAGAHHEKLNGQGYPSGLAAEDIPFRSKIMTIADIYDALTARDRPYKKSMPIERALDILGYEVKDNHVDGELVRIFREAEVFKVVEGQ